MSDDPAGVPAGEPIDEPAGDPLVDAPAAGAAADAVPSPSVVEVVRTGGFAGLTMRGEVDLDALDQEQRAVWQQLLSDRLARPTPHEPAPDRFVYRVQSRPAGLDLTLGDHELPDDVRTLLDTVVHPQTP